ncbi:MAG: hypothetical protein IIC51_10830 [Planctomycetes bacterium]|nr:hypothetical protein [Planctomycetota bacterium]
MFSKMYFGSDLPTWSLFLELIVAGTIVILAGSRLARSADKLAKQLNVGSGWIGLILLATITSLPEMVTGGTATAIGNVDLAMGAIFGSCCFNITLIFMLNAFRREGSVLGGDEISKSHTLTSSFGLALMTIALLGIVMIEKFESRPQLAQACELVWSVLIAVAYLGCIRLVYRCEQDQGAAASGAGRRQPVGRALIANLAVMAIIIAGAAWWLAVIGDTLSTHEIELIGRPLGATFVGAFFLAFATSLPEIVTSIAAVRMGNLDLALGNIFGSNMFNMFVIPWLKLVSLGSGQELMLAGAGENSTSTLITGLLAILLTAIAVGGLAYKSKRRLLRGFGFDSLLILLTYVGGMTLLLMNGSP